MKKLVVLSIVVILLFSALAGCKQETPVPQEETEVPQQGAEATEAVQEETEIAQEETESPQKENVTVVAGIRAESLDPASGKVGDHTVYHAIYDALVKYGPEGVPQPALAEDWDVSEDGLTYTFYLREGVTFHDGSDFTADDVIYTFDTIKDVPLFIRFFMEPAVFASWEKVDDYTVKFTTSLPYTKFLSVMALMGQILPEERADDPDAFEANPIGTGPYKFVSFEADGTVKLEAYADYYLGEPAYQTATIRPPMDPSTAVVALQNGEVDLIMNVPPAQLPLIEGDDNLEVVQKSGWSTYVMALMGESLSDVNLRKAIFHAVDTEKLILVANEGIGEPASDLFNALTLGDLAGSVDFVGYDPELAQEYLAKSDYAGETFMITVTPVEAVLAQSIQADLLEIGINTEIEQLDINGWAGKVMTGEAQISIHSSGGVAMSREAFLSNLSSTAPYFGNVMQTTDEFEEIIAAIRTEGDPEARKELVKQGLIIQYDLANQVPLYDMVSNFAHNKDVTNIEPISAVTQVFYIGDFK